MCNEDRYGTYQPRFGKYDRPLYNSSLRSTSGAFPSDSLLRLPHIDSGRQSRGTFFWCSARSIHDYTTVSDSDKTSGDKRKVHLISALAVRGSNSGDKLGSFIDKRRDGGPEARTDKRGHFHIKLSLRNYGSRVITPPYIGDRDRW